MLKDFFRLIRLNHWIKNLFVIAPLIFSLNFLDNNAVIKSVIAFLSFCFISTSNYIINDIIDREKDKYHPIKKNRPIASGKISVFNASLLFLLFLLASFLLSYLINIHFIFVLLFYTILNLLYSIYLKNIVIIDVMIVAAGFVLRVIAGSVAIDVQPSNWILLTTLFISLFLGFGKRRHEMSILTDVAYHRPVLKHYSTQLLDSMIMISATLTIITYALYAVDVKIISRLETGKLVYTVPFVVYGILKYLFVLYKQHKGGDPADIVLHDKTILLDILLWGVTIISFLYFNNLNRIGL